MTDFIGRVHYIVRSGGARSTHRGRAEGRGIIEGGHRVYYPHLNKIMYTPL